MTRSPPLGGMLNRSDLAATLGVAHAKLPLQPEDAQAQAVEQAVGQYFAEGKEHSRVGAHRVASLRRRLGQGAEYRVGDKLGRASRPCARDSVGDGGPIGVGVACTASGGEPLYGSFRSCLEFVDGAGGDRATLDQDDVYAPGEAFPGRHVRDLGARRVGASPGGPIPRRGGAAPGEYAVRLVARTPDLEVTRRAATPSVLPLPFPLACR